MIIIKKITATMLIILLLTTSIMSIAYADVPQNNDSLNTEVTIEAQNATTFLDVNSQNSEVGVDTGDDSLIGVNTGVRSEVYINGEDLNNLRPQYHIKKTSYNDNWIHSELEFINNYLNSLDQGLVTMYAKEANEVNELFKALAMLRSELYQEMYRLHFGQTMVKTIIGTDAYTVNSDIFKFDTLTSYRVSDFITLMSVRLLESLGVQFYYEKVDDVRVITMVYGDKNVVLRENSDIMVVFDSKEAKKIKLKNPMVIIGPRTYIPTRDVSEHLGFEVLWDEVNDTIMISLPQAEKPLIEIDEAIYEEEKEPEEKESEEKTEDQDSEQNTEEVKKEEPRDPEDKAEEKEKTE